MKCSENHVLFIAMIGRAYQQKETHKFLDRHSQIWFGLPKTKENSAVLFTFVSAACPKFSACLAIIKERSWLNLRKTEL